MGLPWPELVGTFQSASSFAWGADRNLHVGAASPGRIAPARWWPSSGPIKCRSRGSGGAGAPGRPCRITGSPVSAPPRPKTGRWPPADGRGNGQAGLCASRELHDGTWPVAAVGAGWCRRFPIRDQKKAPRSWLGGRPAAHDRRRWPWPADPKGNAVRFHRADRARRSAGRSCGTALGPRAGLAGAVSCTPTSLSRATSSRSPRLGPGARCAETRRQKKDGWYNSLRLGAGKNAVFSSAILLRAPARMARWM